MPIDECTCPRGRRAREGSGVQPAGAPSLDPTDGVIRIRRESKGRGGKMVTTISGVPADRLDALAADLKRRCGTGGSVKDGLVVIQGDVREKAAVVLQAQGFRVKLAGG